MKEFYLTREVAEIFRITRRTVYNYVRDKKLRAIRIGGCLRIPHTEIERLRKRKNRVNP